MKTQEQIKKEIRAIGDSAINNAVNSAKLVDDGAKGTIYLCGSMVVIEWETDSLGRKLDDGRETWILPDSNWGKEQSARNFDSFVIRFN